MSCREGLVMNNMHSIIVENRKKIMVSGVKDVESYNENDMVIVTHSGGLKIKGKNLEITKMNIDSSKDHGDSGNSDGGSLEMAGEITSLHYSDFDRAPNNIITKLFR
jgi:sporulation protein YabP